VGRDKKGAKRVPTSVPEGGWQAAKKAVPSGSPTDDKKPVVLGTDNENVRARRLVWRFNEVDFSKTWSPAHVTPAQMKDLLEKMASFETMTIGEIFAPGSQHGKKYSTDILPSPALRRLEEIERDDETEIARLRCGGAPRLYGFLREHVFHVVWWDPKHTVYPSKKKNT